MSETVNFTLDDVVAKVREVAAEKPTYVYDNGTGGELSSCFYRHGADRSQPGCIVGQALDRLGYVVPDEMEGNNSSAVIANAFGVLDAQMWERDTILAGWIRYVQARQDEGRSWGEAVEGADSLYKFALPA